MEYSYLTCVPYWCPSIICCIKRALGVGRPRGKGVAAGEEAVAFNKNAVLSHRIDGSEKPIGYVIFGAPE